MTELYEASNQWMRRPDDERFWTIDEMRASLQEQTNRSREVSLHADSVRAEYVGTQMTLNTNEGRMGLTPWSFRQVCQSINAPAPYLARIGAHDPGLAQTLLNKGLRDHGLSCNQALVTETGETPKLRGLTSKRYNRLWNVSVIERLEELQEDGWRVPPAAKSGGARSRIATAEDVIDFGADAVLSVKEGDEIAPSGLYGSDRDVWAFMVRPDRRIDDGTEGGLMRGFFVWNSEVGDKSIGATSFLLRAVCGNHIVWGAKDVVTMRAVHTGDVAEKLRAMLSELDLRAGHNSAAEDEQAIRRAQSKVLGEDQDEVVHYLYKKRLLSQRNLRAAYILAEDNAHVDGDPRTVWGMAQGITRLSQRHRQADERHNLDRAAGTLLASTR